MTDDDLILAFKHLPMLGDPLPEPEAGVLYARFVAMFRTADPNLTEYVPTSGRFDYKRSTQLTDRTRDKWLKDLGETPVYVIFDPQYEVRATTAQMALRLVRKSMPQWNLDAYILPQTLSTCLIIHHDRFTYLVPPA